MCAICRIAVMRLIFLKNTIQSVFADQMEATRLSLRHCQVSANKAALENLVSAREEIYQRALKEFSDGKVPYCSSRETRLMSV